jgi:hypothetical protein
MLLVIFDVDKNFLSTFDTFNYIFDQLIAKLLLVFEITSNKFWING